MSKDKPDLYTIEPPLINKYTGDDLSVFTQEILSVASAIKLVRNIEREERAITPF